MSEILRPNGVGDETALLLYPNTGEANWEDICDVIPDDVSTYVYNSSGNYKRDLYAIPAGSGLGKIVSVIVYFRAFTYYTHAKPVIKSNGSVTEGTEIALTGTWITYSQEWTTNPNNNNVPWTWNDINGNGGLAAMQIGIALEGYGKSDAQCTQVYIVINTKIIKIIGSSIFMLEPSGVSPEEQTTQTSIQALGVMRPRIGQRLFIPHKTVTKLAFWLEKYGSPTGDVTFTIRRVANDSILNSKVWGDAANISIGGWHEATFNTPTLINDEVRIMAEFSGGGGSDFLWFGIYIRDIKSSEYYTEYIAAYLDEQRWEAAYKYYYTGGYQGIIKRLRSIKLISSVIGLTETVIKKLIKEVVLKIINEAVGINETVLKRLRSVRWMIETVEVTEAVVKRFWSIKIIDSTLTVVEGVAKKLWLCKVIQKSISIAEETTKRLWCIKVITVTISLVESIVKITETLTQVYKKVIAKLPSRITTIRRQ